jgi:cytochrome c-type biogenesis protein CcmH/NrfG
MLMKLANLAASALMGAAAVCRLSRNVSHARREVRRRLPHSAKKESEVTMKKSVFAALVVALAAAAGALAACAVYLHRREKELDEYERLLFSDDAGTDADAAPDKAEPAGDEPAEGSAE